MVSEFAVWINGLLGVSVGALVVSAQLASRRRARGRRRELLRRQVLHDIGWLLAATREVADRGVAIPRAELQVRDERIHDGLSALAILASQQSAEAALHLRESVAALVTTLGTRFDLTGHGTVYLRQRLQQECAVVERALSPLAQTPRREPPSAAAPVPVAAGPDHRSGAR
jgi:hypothetical protein